MKSKKGQVLDQLGALSIGIVVFAITLVVVFLILSQVGSNATVTADGNASATVTSMTEAANDLPAWVPIIVITFIGALLLGLVAMFRRNA